MYQAAALMAGHVAILVFSGMPIISLTRNVVDFRSRDIMLGDFSHTLLELRAAVVLSNNLLFS